MNATPIPTSAGLRHPARLLLALSLLAGANLAAATLYVSLGSPNPSPPYATWATAATNIQEAVDAAAAGDEIVVTNGVYAIGHREMPGVGFSRVAVSKALKLLSVNGPEATTIQGAKAPGGGNGDGAVRCVYLSRGASLSGFTLANGATRVNDLGGWESQNCGGGVYCGSTTAMLTNCVLAGNSARYDGGGVYGGTLYNCALTGNSANYGGGAYGAALRNCTFTDNSAFLRGGGASESTLYNCTLTRNSAWGGAGAAWCTLYNCIVYFNQGANWDASTFEYSCTVPLPEGVGNIAANPQFIFGMRLSTTSPCLGVGHSSYASGVDMDGDPWADPPAMGADQLWPGQSVGPVSVRIRTDFTQVPVGFPAPFTADIAGPITQCAWDFGDGTFVTNQVVIRHPWREPGAYTVRLTAYNDGHPEGVTESHSIEVIAEVIHYVNAANTTPAFPYRSWATAATNIQDAINASPVAGRLVLVTDGVYQSGSVEMRGTNRVALTNAVLRSVNGPDATIIDGGGEVRCVYLGADAILSGFTLRNGWAGGDGPALSANGGAVLAEASGVVTNCVLTASEAYLGGGAYGGTLHNCTLRGNTGFVTGGAFGSTLHNCTLAGNTAWGDLGGGHGGGAARSTLYNCKLTANSAVEEGGGALDSTLYNCTLIGNHGGIGGGVSGGLLYNCTVTDNSATGTGHWSESVRGGGGVFGATLYNCLVYLNRAPRGPNWWDSQTGGLGGDLQTKAVRMVSSCSTPLPPGVGNIDADPRFLNVAAGDFRLRSDSPCIDAGTSLSEFLTTDILGLPRPLDGNGDGVARFDMGAYEFNPYQFGPVLRLAPDGFHFTILGEPGKTARVERSRDLFHWELVAAVPIPTSGKALIDPAAVSEGMLFYRALPGP